MFDLLTNKEFKRLNNVLDDSIHVSLKDKIL